MSEENTFSGDFPDSVSDEQAMDLYRIIKNNGAKVLYGSGIITLIKIISGSDDITGKVSELSELQKDIRSYKNMLEADITDAELAKICNTFGADGDMANLIMNGTNSDKVAIPEDTQRGPVKKLPEPKSDDSKPKNDYITKSEALLSLRTPKRSYKSIERRIKRDKKLSLLFETSGRGQKISIENFQILKDTINHGLKPKGEPKGCNPTPKNYDKKTDYYPLGRAVNMLLNIASTKEIYEFIENGIEEISSLFYTADNGKNRIKKEDFPKLRKYVRDCKEKDEYLDFEEAVEMDCINLEPEDAIRIVNKNGKKYRGVLEGGGNGDTGYRVHKDNLDELAKLFE